MGTAIVAIGIPGSGKSTHLQFAATLFRSGYVSTDAIREEITGDASDISQDSKIWPIAYERAATFLKDEEFVIFDATNAKLKDRKKLLSHLRDSGATEILGVFFSVSLDTAKARNAGRERTVPEFVLDRMYQSLQDNPPSVEDGFTELVTWVS